jgi:Leucine-rich repeat (LRR) protein
MIEGMKHLKDLILRNNSIDDLSRESFLSIQELISLDLSYNDLVNIKSGTFAPLQRLHLLKLNNNKLETIEQGAFDWKVDNLLLDGLFYYYFFLIGRNWLYFYIYICNYISICTFGRLIKFLKLFFYKGNSLRCDEKLDWFIDWLVQNKVRTFVPDQPEIRCASPEQKHGTRLKELMIKRNNLTDSLISTSLKNIPGIQQNKNSAAAAAGNLLANWLPNAGGQQRAGSQIGSDMLNAISQNIPELRNLPGMEFVKNLNPTSKIGKQKSGGNAGGLDSAIDTVFFKEKIILLNYFYL